MKSWNFSDFSAIEEPVVAAYSGGENVGRPALPASRKHSAFRVALGVVALTVNISLVVLQTNSAKLDLPLSPLAVAHTVVEEQPPLESFFRNRFTSEWTQEQESKLLMALDQRRSEGASSSLVEQTIDTVFSNQHEDLSEQRNRIGRQEVANLLRGRRSGR